MATDPRASGLAKAVRPFIEWYDEPANSYEMKHNRFFNLVLVVASLMLMGAGGIPAVFLESIWFLFMAIPWWLLIPAVVLKIGRGASTI